MKRIQLRRAAVVAGFLLAAAAVVFLYACLNGRYRRVLQTLCFILPFVLLLVWSAGREKKLPLAGVVVFIAAVLLAIEGGVRGFLFSVYGANLRSSFVITAVANTVPSQALQFIQTTGDDIALWIGAALIFCAVSAAVIAWAFSTRSGGSVGMPRLLVLLVIFVTAAVTVFSWSKPSWRRHYPVASWIDFNNRVLSMRRQWISVLAEHDNERRAAKDLVAGIAEGPRTIVFIIGESMSSDNMSLYGYPRDTTPRMKEEASGPGFFVFRDSWAAATTTVEAFSGMFDFTVPEVGNSNIFAVFREAGYRLTWIETPDSLAIRSRWAYWASNVVSLNHESGRSAEVDDSLILPEIEKALAEPDEKKLVVVHLIGQHPRFSLRSSGVDGVPWREDGDEVVLDLKSRRRSSFTVSQRNDYDRAVLYGDMILGKSLEIVRNGKQDVPTSWCFISDHGTETGSYMGHAGHTPLSPSSWRIPFIVWANESMQSEWKRRIRQDDGFRADWLKDFLLDLGGIRIREPEDGRSPLSEPYLWEDPPAKKRFAGNAQG